MPLSFFYKNQQNFDEAKCFFKKSLQPQNVLIMFSFSMKHSYLLTAKIIPDVNKSNFYMV